MRQNPKSEGKCLFCGEVFAKAGVHRHLQTHLEQKAKENAAGQSYLVKIEADPYYGALPYFLSLWVDGNATMKNIDDFLRNIWLECCGHLSAFTNPKNRKQSSHVWDIEAMKLLKRGEQKGEKYDKFMEKSNGEAPMSRKISEVFCKGLKLKYRYDFGSSTALLLTVLEEYPAKADKRVILLSRNEPLEWLCDACKKEPATQICTIHDWDEDVLFCAKCAEKHKKKCEDFRDYAAMPVVNSPRMGVCVYEGGTIDIKRDGVFRNNKIIP
jgi:hypothetical protein